MKTPSFFGLTHFTITTRGEIHIRRTIAVVSLLGLVSCGLERPTFRASSLNPNVHRTRVDFKAVRVAQVRRRKTSADGTSTHIQHGFWATPKDTFLIQVDTTPTPPSGSRPGGVLQEGVEASYLDYQIVSEDENGLVIIRILPRVEIATADISTSSPLTTSEITTITAPTSPNTTTVTTAKSPVAGSTTVTTATSTDDTPASRAVRASESTVKKTTQSSTTAKTWVVRRSSDKNQKRGDPTNAYNYLFAVKKDAFPALSKTYMGSKFWGVPVVHPFKLRPNQANLGPQLLTDITITYCFGYRARLSNNPLKESFVTFIPVGFGVGAAKYRRMLPGDILSDEEDNASITYWQAGVFFTIHKVGIGVFTGLDAMIGRRNDWIYQSKPWFSFGIGYKFKEG